MHTGSKLSCLPSIIGTTRSAYRFCATDGDYEKADTFVCQVSQTIRRRCALCNGDFTFCDSVCQLVLCMIINCPHWVLALMTSSCCWNAVEQSYTCVLTVRCLAVHLLCPKLACYCRFSCNTRKPTNWSVGSTHPFSSSFMPNNSSTWVEMNCPNYF